MVNPSVAAKASSAAKTAADRGHQRPRWQRLTPMVAEKAYNSLLRLETRHIDVEVDPIDPLHRKLYMFGENFRHALCYHPAGSDRAGFALKALDPWVQLSLVYQSSS